MNTKRVVITGIGAVTPLGNSFADSWKTALEGGSGLGLIRRFDAQGLRWTVSGETKRFDPGLYLNPREVEHLDPFVHFALAAARMALSDAGLRGGGYLEAGGIIMGSSRGGISLIEKAVTSAYCSLTHSRGRLSPFLMPATTVNAAPSFCAQKLGIRGYCLGISNACVSGTNAIGEAFRLIHSGYAGPVLAGGAEAPVCRLCIEGYGSSGALSKRNDISASRPFDKGRDGFVLAEGSCVLVLEGLENALRRGASIYAEITGYANTVDAFHMTKPDARGEAAAIRTALTDAGIAPEDVDYINTHGTSTRLGDMAEAKALQEVFGERAARIPASGLKSMTGHMLSASGPLEAAFTLMTLKTGIVPPTTNLTEKDPGCNLNILTGKSEISCSHAITQSFGFGGVNAVLVLKKFRE